MRVLLIGFAMGCAACGEATPRARAPAPEAAFERSEPAPPAPAAAAGPAAEEVAIEPLLRDPDALFAHLDRARRACGEGTVSRSLGHPGLDFRFPRWCLVLPFGRVRGAGEITWSDDRARVTLDHLDVDDGLAVRDANLTMNGRRASWTYTGALVFSTKPDVKLTEVDTAISDTFAARAMTRVMLGAALSFGKSFLNVAGPVLVATAKAGSLAGTTAGAALLAGAGRAASHAVNRR